ncbi:hypothetical protein VZC37_21845 [Gordonia sp. LSe1-13]|uniref:Uncharacterized protein n=1 Tax=Gordonia sesuvii TaxID=3116777 RepID=A0ABU7MIY0_9ACTN|nr:hypothetical protein [Gordonia sp. LSe1-13]
MTASEPASEGLVVEKNPIAGECTQCGAATLAAYPVLSEGGWFRVVKCQTCLHSMDREPWTRLGPVSLTSEGIAIA